jgi:hypothetical protein
VNGIMLGFRNVNREITVDRNVGAGLIEAVVYIGLAMIAVRLI